MQKWLHNMWNALDNNLQQVGNCFLWLISQKRIFFCYSSWWSNRKYGHITLRLTHRHEHCLSKFACCANNHTLILTRCIKNRIVPKDLQVWPPVPTKGTCRVAELVSMRFLREWIRLTWKAKGDAKKKAESIAQSSLDKWHQQDTRTDQDQHPASHQRQTKAEIWYFCARNRRLYPLELLIYVDKSNWVIK